MSKRYALKRRRGHIFVIMRHLKQEQAEVLIERGKAEPRCDNSGVWLEMLGSGENSANAASEVRLGMRLMRSAMDPTARPSSAVLTRAEVEAAIGMRGRSNTLGMSEHQREQRVRAGRCAEDFVERSVAKLAAFG